MLIATIVTIVLILILSMGFLVFGSEMVEYNKGFLYFASGMLVLIAGFAVFLMYAVPSFAKFDPRSPKTAVTQDTSNLLEE